MVSSVESKVVSGVRLRTCALHACHSPSSVTNVLCYLPTIKHVRGVS